MKRGQVVAVSEKKNMRRIAVKRERGGVALWGKESPIPGNTKKEGAYYPRSGWKKKGKGEKPCFHEEGG